MIPEFEFKPSPQSTRLQVEQDVLRFDNIVNNLITSELLEVDLISMKRSLKKLLDKLEK